MHIVADAIAPHQNGMVAVMIPHIRVSDRPLRQEGVAAGDAALFSSSDGRDPSQNMKGSERTVRHGRRAGVYGVAGADVAA